MKAMVFAAGLGTRLRPITDSMPKALVEVGGKPVLQLVIERLKEAGIVDIVVNVHHFPDAIIGFLRSNGNFGLNIAISDERDMLLDTGGGLLRALSLFGGDDQLMLYNADIVSDFPIEQMMCRHADAGAEATLLVSDRESSRRLLFDGAGRMMGWRNIATGETRPGSLDDTFLTPLAFGGVHIVSPELFPLLEDYRRRNGNVFSITPFYIETCATADIRAFTPSQPFRWFDIGRPSQLQAARNVFYSV